MDKIPFDDDDFLVKNLTQLITEDPTFDFLVEYEHRSADEPDSTEGNYITASDSQEATGYSHGATPSSNNVSGYNSYADYPGCSHDFTQYDHDRPSSIESTSKRSSGVPQYDRDEAQYQNNPGENILDNDRLECAPAGIGYKHISTERHCDETGTGGYIGDQSTYNNVFIKHTDDMSAQRMTTRYSSVTHDAASTHDDAPDHFDTSGDIHTSITETQQENHTCPMHSNPHQCKESSEKNICMDQEENFTRGKQDERREQPHVCEICTKVFRSDSDLKLHSDFCAEEKVLVTTICGKTLKSKSLDHDTLIHTAQNPYECKYCHKFFTKSCNLKYHTRIHTKEKPYKCQYCPKCFTDKSTLNRHTRTHTGKKPYECNYCHKFFTQKSNLNCHTRIHTGEKPYECSFCPKCFTDKSYLNRHTLTHTGKKPYECNFCPKLFTQKSNLSRHIRSHTGEKPYKCNHCSRLFIQKSNLNSHIRIHTGEKPYECSYCPTFFTNKSTLNRHIRTHTRKKPYKCS